jgi:hypothetical protein
LSADLEQEMDTTKELLKTFEELLSQSRSDRMRNARNLNEALGDVAKSGVDRAAVVDRFRTFVNQRGTTYGKDLAQIGLEVFRSLLDLNERYNAAFFAEVFGQKPWHEETAPEGIRQPAATIEMKVAASLAAASAESSFVIENKHDQSSRISFLVSEFTESGSERTFRLPVQFTPSGFVLRSGEERVVRMSCPMNPALLEAGRTYNASVIVRGIQDLEIQLQLEVEKAPASGGAAATKTAKRRRSRRKPPPKPERPES